MSKLLDALQERFTGDRKALDNFPMVSISESIEELDYNENYAYEIKAVFGVSGTCPKNGLGRAMINVNKQLKLSIYGDLQSLILKLELALYEQGVSDNDTLSILREIQREVS